MTCTSYCEKIEELFDAIIRIADEVLPENRKYVDEYISCVWNNVTVWVMSIKREKGTEELRSKFESHVMAEEAKFQRNLEDIMYDIDTYDTVKLVARNGRAETVIPRAPPVCPSTLTFMQFLFPMLYLLLKRDLERISLARKHVLSHFELWDAVETIVYITNAAGYRLIDLRGETEMLPLYYPPSHRSSIAIYEHQNLDAGEQFKMFAKGLVCTLAASQPCSIHKPFPVLFRSRKRHGIPRR
jgi:hypothetical protein